MESKEVVHYLTFRFLSTDIMSLLWRLVASFASSSYSFIWTK